nr:splicing factor 3A subunit 3-like [Lytechinus pictus]
METILEQQRRIHEEKERVVDALVKETLHKKTNNREQINSDFRAKQLLDRFVEGANTLRELYDDRDGLRKEEIQALSGPNEFAEFYTRLKVIKDFHRKHPNEKVDYVTYLSIADRLFEISKDKKNAEYRRYLDLILSYLQDYASRVKPILDFAEELDKVKKEFDIQWEAGTFPGWPKEAASAMTHAGAHLDLSAFSSSEIVYYNIWKYMLLLKLLNDNLEKAVWNRSQSSCRKFNSMTAFHTGAFKLYLTRDAEKQRDTAFLEAQAYYFFELLGEQRQATRENVQRKQARTGTEREDEDEEHFSDSDSDDEEEVIYNPKNLPLGWDGKPIPYWLYKLHGLNISYSCEICGNQTYRGPKAFQRHFAEWRHAHGMRCLGIPNTAHFANVTHIEDALALWEKLKNNKASERWLPEAEEEFEDTIGNVVNKKTFEDLKRQGLL